MTKQAPFAREDVMQAYLDGLLTEPDTVDSATARAAKLLEQAAQQMAEDALVVEDTVSDAEVADEVTNTTIISTIGETEEPLISVENEEKTNFDIESSLDTDVNVKGENKTSTAKVALRDMVEERFQALFFEVAGLTLAVPLITLGGIYQLDKIGPLFGKPDWYMGVMLHRGAKLNVVDSAKWVMPEKYDEELAQSLNYRYLIMLGNSLWGLTSEKLINTVTLTKADVKWRESTGKRPWLAGMVKEKMCALIDVDELISMLNKGLGSNDQTP